MSSDQPSPPESWGQRHFTTLFTVVLAALLALVTTVQVAC